MDDRAVGYDRLVSLHVLGGVCQAVDGAALRAGADGHAGDGLVAAHAIHCARPPGAVLRLLARGHTRQSETLVSQVRWLVSDCRECSSKCQNVVVDRKVTRQRCSKIGLGLVEKLEQCFLVRFLSYVHLILR